MAKKKPTYDEVDELDRTYVTITGYKPKRLKKKKKKAWFPLLLVLILILAAAGAFCWYASQHTDLFDSQQFMQDVTIAGVPLEGMTKEEAKAALNRLVEDTYLKQPMVIQVLDTTLELSPVYTEIKVDVDQAVDTAYAEGVTGEFDLQPWLTMNETAVKNAAESLGKQYNIGLQQTETIIEGSVPDLSISADPNQKGMTIVVKLGHPQYGLDVEKLHRQILEAYRTGTFLVTGECRILEPERPDLDALYTQTYVAPTDAILDPKTFEVTPELNGYHFDLEKAKEAVASAEYGETVTVSFVRIPPAVTGQSLSAHLFRDVLGSAQTPYIGEDTNNRNTNLAVACEAINGLVLLPGETFNYNETLGERTAEAGYKPAPSYVSGLTVDTLGGGICQISSTLYYSTLFADLEIIERHNHGYVSDYIPKGMDATVTWGGANFQFRNNTEYPIRIEAWRADGYVNVRILGTEVRDYYVKMSYRVVETKEYTTVYQEMPPDNKEKFKDGHVIVTPYTGYVVQTYKEKYSKETDELLSKEKWTFDVYKKRDRVVCKIVVNDAPTEGTESGEAVG